MLNKRGPENPAPLLTVTSVIRLLELVDVGNADEINILIRILT